jgi:hypothetical protein
MYAIFALFNGHFQMATFEVFETIEEAEQCAKEMKSEAEQYAKETEAEDYSVRFFIEIR